MNNFADPGGKPAYVGGGDWGGTMRNTEQSAFWRAFWTGLASATCLYAEPAPYWTAVFAIPNPAQSFAAVGARLTQAIGAPGAAP
jgi:hypothetical protein